MIKIKKYTCTSIAIDIMNHKYTCKWVRICYSVVFEMLSVFAEATTMLVVLAILLLSVPPILREEGT